MVYNISLVWYKMLQIMHPAHSAVLKTQQWHIRINNEKALYLHQLIVFLQDQVYDITHDRDFPLRETPLEELLLGQYGFIVENIS